MNLSPAVYYLNTWNRLLIKYQLHFDFLVVFTPLLRPCQLLYHVSWLLYYWSLHFFFFFVLTSGRPFNTGITTFFVFSKPLCSEDRDSGIFCTAAIALFIPVKGLSTVARNSQNLLLLQPALLQLFCSTSWSHSAALMLVSYGNLCFPIKTHWLTYCWFLILSFYLSCFCILGCFRGFQVFPGINQGYSRVFWGCSMGVPIGLCRILQIPHQKRNFNVAYVHGN